MLETKTSHPHLKKRLILGIDPGFSGALALYDPLFNEVTHIRDMPTLKKTAKTAKTKKGKLKVKTEIDIDALNDFLRSMRDEIGFCVIEEVSVMTGREGRMSMFNFGKGVGILIGALAAHDILVLSVKPEIWKSAIGLSRDKKASVMLARKKFPEMDKLFKDSKDGRAEAALLAEFGKKSNLWKAG